MPWARTAATSRTCRSSSAIPFAGLCRPPPRRRRNPGSPRPRAEWNLLIDDCRIASARRPGLTALPACRHSGHVRRPLDEVVICGIPSRRSSQTVESSRFAHPWELSDGCPDAGQPSLTTHARGYRCTYARTHFSSAEQVSPLQHENGAQMPPEHRQPSPSAWQILRQRAPPAQMNPGQQVLASWQGAPPTPHVFCLQIPLSQ